MLFRQLFDPVSSTYTYLLADPATRAAVLVDPVFEQAQRDGALIRELGLKLECTIETHVHADHVTAAWLHQQQLGSRIVVGERTGAEGADCYLADDEAVEFGSLALRARATPGHTAGCITLVLGDESLAMTGDCLLVRGCGRTDFQGGDARTMYRSIHERIFTLPGECLLYPGHDYRGNTVTTVAEERAFNPRLGGQLSESDFVGYMQNLGLPHPKQIDVAVPANRRCGHSDSAAAVQAAPGWAPLAFTYAGFWEVGAPWVEEHLGAVQVVDVREPEEYTGPLGHIAGARLLPLGQLGAGLGALDRERPVVTVCRAGGRSAQGAMMLQKAGFARVANLGGGMLRWHAQGLPVVEAGEG